LDPLDVTPSVTVRNLLTHSSGIDCAEDFTDTGDADDCLERYVVEAVSGSRVFHRPGERWSYCNGGFSVLGRLIEVLDGRAWDDAVIARIFDPLGLSATTTARLSPDRPVAEGHRYDSTLGSIVAEPGRMPRSASPAGNVLATAADLVEFAQALLDGGGRLLERHLVEEMIRPQVTIRDGSQALGWSLPAPGLVAHGGATRGSTAFLGAIPGAGALAVVANGPGAGAIAAVVATHLFGIQPLASPSRGTGPDLDPKACIGRYERRHVVQDISLEDGRLLATTTFHGPLTNLFASPTPVTLESIGGARFISNRSYEDSPTVWDFDMTQREAPSLLLTNRLHERA
jgi:CubicO group peptidase (beta-lactamase class C family)